MQLKNTLNHYLQLIRFNRPIGSLLLLWPTLTALVIASHGRPSAQNVLIFTLGVFLMRSAGCIINDFIDRNVDHKVKRTQNRPLTQGKVSVYGALSFCAILLIIAFILVLQTNPETIALAFIAVLLTACYPFMKRITHLPQLWLGITFNWGIIMAFTAANKIPGLVCWLLYIATVINTVAYDTFYAMADRDDDLQIGIKSTAILFGQRDRLYTAILQLIYFAIMCLIGELMHFNHYYTLGLALTLLCLIYQQYLIRHREPANCLKAFLSNHYALLFIFLGILMSYLP